MWPLGAGAGPRLLPGISGLAPPVSCPSFIWDCQLPPRYAALLGLPHDPSPPHSLRGLPYPAAPAPLGTHSTPQPKASRPCLIHSLHPSTQAPTPAPRLPPRFSLPVLMSPIHLPLSKIHPLMPSLSHIETKTHRPRNRLAGRHRTLSCHTGTRTRALAPAAPAERGTQRRHLSVHAHKHPHPRPPPCPHKGADTLGGRDKGAHICGRRGTPPPRHTHHCRPREGGLVPAGAPPLPCSECFPTWPARSLGKGP